MPKVLLVGGEGIPSGVPRHICHLAKAFDGIADVTVISDINHGGYDALAELGSRHITLSGLSSRLSLGHMWRGWRGLLAFLRGSQADLTWIHPRFPSLMGRMALALRLWRPKGATAFTIHGLPYGKGHKPYASFLSLTLEKALMRTCPPTNIIFLSQDMADRAREMIGASRLTRHGIHVLPNCSDLGELPPFTRPKDPTLVMTGRAGRQKNYACAVRLMNHLPENTHLMLCGTGTDTEKFQAEIAGLVPAATCARIYCIGPVQDVRPLLRAADAYLLTSRYEGTPIGTLEAFEAGLPIILADFEGADALVDRHPMGIKIDPSDLETSGKQVTEFLRNARVADRALRQQIRTVWHREWSPDVFDERARALLHRLLAN